MATNNAYDAAAAQAAYAEGGDKALADYYINSDPRTTTRNQVNPAKAIQAGKKNLDGSDYSFTDAANEEIKNYNGAVNNYEATKGNYHPAYKGPGALNNTFQFVLDNPYSGGSDEDSNKQQSGGGSNSQEPSEQTKTQQVKRKVVPYNPEKINFDTNWSKAKDKAQSFINNSSYSFDDNDYNFNPNK